MKHGSDPLEFLKKTQNDPELSLRILQAIEKGNMSTAKEVMAIAKEQGFSFDRDEFEQAVRKDIAERFAAGDKTLTNVVDKKRVSESPESSCAKGCLSYTISWHPDPRTKNPASRPVEGKL
jgi:hypothetical protein